VDMPSPSSSAIPLSGRTRTLMITLPGSSPSSSCTSDVPALDSGDSRLAVTSLIIVGDRPLRILLNDGRGPSCDPDDLVLVVSFPPLFLPKLSDVCREETGVVSEEEDDCAPGDFGALLGGFGNSSMLILLRTPRLGAASVPAFFAA
jgi:hypothetical protein